MKFRKKPVEVEAWPVADIMRDAALNWKALPKRIRDGYERGEVIFGARRIFLSSLEGNMEAQRQDWIICGVKNELYPCKPDIFAATYDPVLTAPADLVSGGYAVMTVSKPHA